MVDRIMLKSFPCQHKGVFNLTPSKLQLPLSAIACIPSAALSEARPHFSLLLPSLQPINLLTSNLPRKFHCNVAIAKVVPNVFPIVHWCIGEPSIKLLLMAARCWMLLSPDIIDLWLSSLEIQAWPSKAAATCAKDR